MGKDLIEIRLTAALLFFSVRGRTQAVNTWLDSIFDVSVRELVLDVWNDRRDGFSHREAKSEESKEGWWSANPVPLYYAAEHGRVAGEQRNHGLQKTSRVPAGRQSRSSE